MRSDIPVMAISAISQAQDKSYFESELRHTKHQVMQCGVTEDWDVSEFVQGNPTTFHNKSDKMK